MDNLKNEVQIENYMEQCFNAKSNIYPEEGPGAGLEENKNLVLCLKNVPKNMDNIALKNVLCSYGDIIQVSKMNDPSNPLRFAECKNEISLEAVLRGMSDNVWNIVVSQKTEKKADFSDSNIHVKKSTNNLRGGHSSSDLRKAVDVVLHPSLRILKVPVYFNHSSETSYYQNNRVTDYIYNTRNSDENSNYHSRYEIIDIKEKELCKYPKTGKNISISNCFVCGNFATQYCGRCNEFYCSKECQTADWSTHKLACLEKPNLTPLVHTKIEKDSYRDLRANNDSNNEMIRFGQKVVITHIEKSNLVFIRSIEKKDNEDYIRILNIIASYASQSKVLSSLPNVGDFVLSQYNNEWLRAIVLHPLNENEILIAYPDIGNTELKSKFNLKEFPVNLKTLKRFSFCVRLKNVQDVVLNDQARMFLYSLVDENYEVKVQYNEEEKIDNFHVVELIGLVTNQNINKKLNVLINPITPSIHETSLFLQDLALIRLKPSSNTKLIILDNSNIEHGFITCIPNEYGEELEKINTQIQQYAQLQSGYYTPRESEICLAKTSKNPEVWYRAICEMLSGNGKPVLSLLDYGNMCEISIENIRKYPKQLNIPCFTNMCYIKGFQKVVKGQNKTLNEVKEKLQNILKIYDLLTVPEINVIDEANYITLPDDIKSRIKQENIIEID